MEGNYICGDETYQKVRLQVATPSGRKIKKGYIWVFVGMTAGLVYFFYDDGSRSAEVFEQHIKRKFLDLKDNPQAQEIAMFFGLLYQFEHKHRIGVPLDNPLLAATEHALKQWDEIPRICDIIDRCAAWPPNSPTEKYFLPRFFF